MGRGSSWPGQQPNDALREVNSSIMAHTPASRFVDYFVICGYDHTKGRPGGRESCSQVGRNRIFIL